MKLSLPSTQSITSFLSTQSLVSLVEKTGNHLKSFTKDFFINSGIELYVVSAIVSYAIGSITTVDDRTLHFMMFVAFSNMKNFEKRKEIITKHDQFASLTLEQTKSVQEGISKLNSLSKSSAITLNDIKYEIEALDKSQISAATLSEGFLMVKKLMEEAQAQLENPAMYEPEDANPKQALLMSNFDKFIKSLDDKSNKGLTDLPTWVKTQPSDLPEQPSITLDH